MGESQSVQQLLNQELNGPKQNSHHCRCRIDPLVDVPLVNQTPRPLGPLDSGLTTIPVLCSLTVADIGRGVALIGVSKV